MNKHNLEYKLTYLLLFSIYTEAIIMNKNHDYEIIANEDFYDKNGLLLLSKGQKISDDIAYRLKTLGKINKLNNKTVENNEIITDNEVVNISMSATKAFHEKYELRNDKILNKPNQILNTIIFDSKAESWWIYVNALSNYIDWVYTHSLDVALISLLIAIELNFNDNDLWNLGLGAFLHDVGKLLIPKKIIQKTDVLTETEMLLMKQHCELGISSLEPFHLSNEITNIVLQHHERLDGSGYPYNLKGDVISIFAKIVMIADAIDAITSSRPYKQPKEMEDAINIILMDESVYPRDIVLIFRNLFKY